MADVTYIQSVPVKNMENSVPMPFFSGRLYRRKGYQTKDLPL